MESDFLIKAEVPEVRVAAPVVGRLVRRIAPLVGMTPGGEEKEPAPGNPLFIPVKGGAVKARVQTVAAH